METNGSLEIYLRTTDQPLFVQRLVCWARWQRSQQATFASGGAAYPTQIVLAPVAFGQQIREITTLIDRKWRVLEHGEAVANAGEMDHEMMVAGITGFSVGEAATPVGGVAAGIGGAAWAFMSNMIFRQSLQEKREEWLKAVVPVMAETFYEAGITKSRLQELSKLSPEQAARILLGEDILFGPKSPLQGVPEGARPELLYQMNRGLEIYVRDLGSIMDKRIDGVEKQVATLTAGAEAMFHFASENRTYIEELRGQMSTIEESLEGLREGLVIVDGRVSRNAADIAQNSADIGFLQTFVYGTLPPEEQLRALKSGFFRGMPVGDRKRAELKITAVIAREKLVKTFGKLSSGSALLGKASELLDLPPGVQKTVSYASTAFAAIGDLFAGNYVGALTTALGAFGKSAAQQRHEELVARLDTLLEGQQELLKKMNQVYKLQVDLLRGEAAILKTMQQFGEFLADHHRYVMDALVAVEAEVVLNRVAISSLSFRGLDAGKVFLSERNAEHLTSWKSLNDHFADYYEQFDQFMEEALVVFGSGRLHENLQMSYSRTVERAKEAAPFCKEIFDPAVSLFRAQYGVGKGAQIVQSALLIPSDRVASLKGKLERMKELSEEKLSPHLGSVDRWLGDLVDPATLLEYGELILQLQGYYPLLDHKKQELYTAEEAMKLERVSRKGLHLLEHLAEMLDVSIAQQALLAGEGNVQAIYELLAGDAKDLDKVHAALRENELLRKNLGLYIALCDGPSPTSYRIARNSGVDLRYLFPSRWKVVEEKGEWTIALDEKLSIPLPPGGAVADGILYQTPDLPALLGMRQAVAQSRFDYLFPRWAREALSEEQQESTRSVILEQGRAETFTKE